jgi:hypothetical protein
VAAKANSRPLLARWHPLVGDSYAVRLDGRGRVSARYALKEDAPSAPEGVYAHYPEGVFAVFVTEAEIWVQWHDRQVKLLRDHEVAWQSTFKGRSFRLCRNGEPDLEFAYRTLVRGPWRLIVDLLVPDDDWGLVADLPSFIHSHFRDGPKLAEMVRVQAAKTE